MGKGGQNVPAGRRVERFNRLLREELSRLISREVRDPRVADVSLIDVVTSPDLRHAKVFYAARVAEAEGRAEVQKGLEAASGFLKNVISRTLRVKYAPTLHFILDSSLDYGAHIDAVLANLDHGGSDDD